MDLSNIHLVLYMCLSIQKSVSDPNKCQSLSKSVKLSPFWSCSACSPLGTWNHFAPSSARKQMQIKNYKSQLNVLSFCAGQLIHIMSSRVLINDELDDKTLSGDWLSLSILARLHWVCISRSSSGAELLLLLPSLWRVFPPASPSVNRGIEKCDNIS